MAKLNGSQKNCNFCTFSFIKSYFTFVTSSLSPRNVSYKEETNGIRKKAIENFSLWQTLHLNTGDNLIIIRKHRMTKPKWRETEGTFSGVEEDSSLMEYYIVSIGIYLPTVRRCVEPLFQSRVHKGLLDLDYLGPTFQQVVPSESLQNTVIL